MALSHAKPGEVFDVSPLGAKVKTVPTSTLVKTDSLEVLRLVIPAGKEIAPTQCQGKSPYSASKGESCFECVEANERCPQDRCCFLPAATSIACGPSKTPRC
jgi:hypothetical protein